MRKLLIVLTLLSSMSTMANNQIVPDFLFTECGAGVIPNNLCQNSGAVKNHLFFSELPEGTELVSDIIFKGEFDGEFGPTTKEIFPENATNLAKEMSLRGRTGAAIASRLVRDTETGEQHLYTWWEVYRD